MAGRNTFPTPGAIAQMVHTAPGSVWRDADGRYYGRLALPAFDEVDEAGEAWWVHLPGRLVPGADKMVDVLATDTIEMPREMTWLALETMKGAQKARRQVSFYYDEIRGGRTATVILRE